MVHDCEGAVSYPVGWVKMVTLLCVVACFNNMKIVCCWGDALSSSKMDCRLCISPCELIYVITMCE